MTRELAPSKAQEAVRTLFGATAEIRPAGGRYFLTVGGELLGDGPDIPSAIRNAVLAHSRAIGATPEAILDLAIARASRSAGKE